ncbi:MAG: zinc-binding dehydrogenase [Acidobacteria bacterium]|nr:zinc-binding dehydrogenase [Acidobacteriota bacterium]
MKAAIFTTPPPTLTIGDLPAPVPGRGELLVKVAACGLCHTDLHYLDHGVATYHAPPLVLGHEPAGVVAECGPEVTGWKKGERVLIPAIFSCGECGYCRSGRENLCQNLEMLGNHRHGALAEYVVAPARECTPLPDEISMEGGCLIADALSTAFHAVERSGIRPGETAVVIGCGGMGVNLVQCATLAGAKVIAVDKVDAKLERARVLGAAETVDASALNMPLSKALRQLSPGGVDVVFEAIGLTETIQQGLASLRKGGTLMTVGYCPKDVALPVSRVMFFELEIKGSLGCPPGKYAAIVELVRRKKLDVDSLVSGVLPLGQIAQALDKLRRGEGFRWVIQP